MAAVRMLCDQPLLQRLVEIVHDLEAGRRAMEAANLAELRELSARVYGEPDA